MQRRKLSIRAYLNHGFIRDPKGFRVDEGKVNHWTEKLKQGGKKVLPVFDVVRFTRDKFYTFFNPNSGNILRACKEVNIKKVLVRIVPLFGQHFK